MSSEMTREKSLKRLTQIGHSMEPVGALNCLGSRYLCRCSIVASTILAHYPDFWMRFHPGGCSFGFSVREDIFDLVTLQIDQKRAVSAATFERKIINTQLGNLPNQLSWQGHNASKNGLARGLYCEPIGDTNAQPATSRKPNDLNNLKQALRDSCKGLHKGSQPLHKDFSGTVGGLRKAFAHLYQKTNLPTATG